MVNTDIQFSKHVKGQLRQILGKVRIITDMNTIMLSSLIMSDD
jgi:hypothetical protein